MIVFMLVFVFRSMVMAVGANFFVIEFFVLRCDFLMEKQISDFAYDNRDYYFD